MKLVFNGLSITSEFVLLLIGWSATDHAVSLFQTSTRIILTVASSSMVEIP